MSKMRVSIGERLDRISKIILGSFERAVLLRLTEARSGARACDPQHRSTGGSRKLFPRTSLVPSGL